MIPLQFLALTFAISLTGFACVWLIPGAQSPQSVRGLPFWLLMVWGPSLAAMLLSFRDGQLGALVSRAVQLSTIPMGAWLLVLAPLALVWLFSPFAPEPGDRIGIGGLIAMIAFNLVLGPLGEELGWRGYLQDHLHQSFGWLEASLLVGAIWLVWHLPLWTIASPHAQISLPLYAGHVMCYAIIIGAAHVMSGGSILPAILIHLTVNMAANLALFSGYRDPNSWFSSSLWAYGALALIAVGWVYHLTGQIGVRGLEP